MQLPEIVEKICAMAITYGIRAIGAAAIFIVGRWTAKLLNRLIARLLTNRKVDVTLTSFVCNLTHIAMLAFVVIASLNQLGIQTASFVAVIGAAGLAIGLALQGSLSNFAAGVLMIIFRPFKVGDFIQAAGVSGSVEAIQIFTTLLQTPDNKIIIMPNAKVYGDNITNFSTKKTRRLELTFNIGYADSIDHARRIILDIITDNERVFKSPEPRVVVAELADSSVHLMLRAWCAPGDLWDIQFETMEKVKKAFDSGGITIPFPQQDVHLYEHKS